MARKKKINFRYYLNRKLKARLANGEEQYPLYLRITFNRKQTEMKVSLHGDDEIYWTDKELEQFDYCRAHGGAINLEKIILQQEAVLEDIIRKEYEQKGDDFHLRGMNDRLHRYLQTVLSILNGNGVKVLELEASTLLPPDKLESITFVAADDGYFLLKALLPDIHKQLSETSMIILQALSSWAYFQSPYSHFKAEDERNKGTLFTWHLKGEKKAYRDFLDCAVSRCDAIDFEKYRSKGDYDNALKLFYHFFDDSFDTKKITNYLDNQLNVLEG